MSDEERTPPTRIRITGLQEAQIEDLERFEYEAANELGEFGIERPPRDQRAIARLTRTHDVYVAEADDEPAGYLAWRDDAPGVAVLDALVVGVAHRRFGIATRLLRELGERARKAGLGEVVTGVHPKASAAAAFLAVSGFTPLAGAGELPPKLAGWSETHAEEQAASGDAQHWRKVQKLGVTEIPGIPSPD